MTVKLYQSRPATNPLRPNAEPSTPALATFATALSWAVTFELRLSMPAEKFRRQLRQEAEQWWQDGLIDADLYGELATRYRFDQLEREARNRFTTILISLGGILLGIGAITFVAANWLVWTRAAKLALLLSVFLSVNCVGFWLWRSRDRGGRHKLGAALLLLGSLLLGANIGLVSQMFHQSGPLYQLLFVWSAGVWCMAIALAMPALAILSVLLAGSAYLPALLDLAPADPLDLWQSAALHLPLLGLLLFVPLVHRSRSAVAGFLTGVLLAGSLVGSALIPQTWASECALILPSALLWGYGCQPEARWTQSGWQAIARSLAVIVLAGLLYGLSFNLWRDFQLDSLATRTAWSWQVGIDFAIATALTLWLWGRGRDRWQRLQFWRQPLALNSGSIALALLVTVAAIALHLHVVALPVLAPVLFNALFFSLAIAAIRDSLAVGSRLTFWGGTALLVLGIATRTLEYNTSLTLKALVFAICGVGIIVAGLWFERNVQADDAPLLSSQLPPTQEDRHA